MTCTGLDRAFKVSRHQCRALYHLQQISGGNKSPRKRLLSPRAESYSRSDKKDKEDESPSWVAKFLEGSDEDEAAWETQDTQPSLKDKVLETLKDEKERSKFWGRIAVLALGAVLLSERISGKGIVTALNMATGVPIWEIEPALGLLVIGIFAVGIYPAIKRVPQSGDDTDTAVDSFQVVAGRLACVVLAGTILAEATTGKGILALLNINTGVEITEIEGGLTFLLLLLFTADSHPDDGQNDKTNKK